MKYLFKGFFLGLSLVLANKICCYIFGEFGITNLEIGSAIIFFLITTVFLVSKNITGLLLCGFCGLFVMFFGEIITSDFFNSEHYSYNDILTSYVGGFYGSVSAVAVSIFLTVKRIKISLFSIKEGKEMSNILSKDLKTRLLLYMAISSIGFLYLVLPEMSGISVPIFALIQLICLWFIVPDRKRLILFIPIFIMSLNCFFSANTIWRPTNFIISAVLYCSMFITFDFKSDSLKYFIDIIVRIIKPFTYFALPFEWISEISNDKTHVIKRIAAALLITIPCALILITVLSNADMVFSIKTENLFSDIFNSLKFNTLLKILCGIIAGMFLFGTMCCAHIGDSYDNKNNKIILKGDLIIINTLLCTILFIYTLFIIIQFKYLFAGSALPEGLTYTEYARKGFFELLALTGINIAAILAVIKLTKNYNGKWMYATKFLCHYLCVVTIILLISSFYRMLLYTNDDGLTRLRFFVMGFLIFEAIGLFSTFLYIAKPNFNITLIYIIIALTYYMVLNIIPVDNIIAKNQIDKYLNNERAGIEYVFTLSADAAPAMEFLYNNTENKDTKNHIKTFLHNTAFSDIPERWQRYNLSTEKAKVIYKKYF